MTGFETIFQAAATNVGASLEWIIVIIAVLGSFIFAAKDFKISIIILMVTMGGVFVWFYEVGYYYVLPLTVFFIALVMLALSLFAVNNSSATGGFT